MIQNIKKILSLNLHKPTPQGRWGCVGTEIKSYYANMDNCGDCGKTQYIKHIQLNKYSKKKKIKFCENEDCIMKYYFY